MLNPRKKYLWIYINISRMKYFEEAGTLNILRHTIWQNLELLIQEIGSIKPVIL